MNWKTLLQDFRGQLSWGRFASFTALVVAVIGQIKGIGADNLRLWLEVAGGGYGASKLTEMVCGRGPTDKKVDDAQ